MRLFYAASSPFVRKVTVVLQETGQMPLVTLEPVYGSPLDPGTMPIAQNPLGKLPTLVRDNGAPLYDSRVITRYLDDLAGAGLYPEAPRLWDSLVVEATADGIIEAALQIVYEGRLRAEGNRSAELVEGQWQKALRAIQTVSQNWIGHLSGPLDIGQIAMGCALGYVDFRLPDRDWRTGNEALAQWYEGFIQRDSMRETMPKDPA